MRIFLGDGGLRFKNDCNEYCEGRTVEIQEF